jgi:hypothetical protein
MSRYGSLSSTTAKTVRVSPLSAQLGDGSSFVKLPPCGERMTEPPKDKTQLTKPKKGKPIEIPVPKKGDVMSFLEKTAKLPDPDAEKRQRS